MYKRARVELERSSKNQSLPVVGVLIYLKKGSPDFEYVIVEETEIHNRIPKLLGDRNKYVFYEKEFEKSGYKIIPAPSEGCMDCHK